MEEQEVEDHQQSLRLDQYQGGEVFGLERSFGRSIEDRTWAIHGSCHSADQGVVQQHPGYVDDVGDDDRVGPV